MHGRFRPVSLWRWGAAVVALVLGGCTPAWDWRTLRWEPLPLQWSLPCRPVETQRPQTVGGQPLRMVQRACVHRGHTWALTCAAVPEPSAVGRVLAHWREAVLAGVQAVQSPQQRDFRAPQALAVPGTGRWQVLGMWQGQPVTLTGAWFALSGGGQVHACHALHLSGDAGEAQVQGAPFWQAMQTP